MLHGYDVSNVNGYISIPTDADFVIAKVSQDISFVDRLFRSHRLEARSRGIGFGGYHYGDNVVQPDGRKSCQFYLKCLGDQDDGEISALDIEQDYGYGGFIPYRSENQPWVIEWGEEFLRERNYKAKLYTSRAGITDFDLNCPEIPELFDLWLASWTSSGHPAPVPDSPDPWQEYKLWQYNADTIDKNKFDGTLEEFKACGKAPSSYNNYESLYWTPMYNLINQMQANPMYPHADAAFHANISNAITLHKIAVGAESPI